MLIDCLGSRLEHGGDFGGVPAAWFRSLVDDLLAKLRPLGALGAEQYEAALAEPLALAAPAATAEP